jgi:hypothetical protein
MRIQVRTISVLGPDHRSLTGLHIHYRPDRWFKDISGRNVVPGVWGNLLTFLGGARSCIGYRFALVEYVNATFYSSAPSLIIRL